MAKRNEKAKLRKERRDSAREFGISLSYGHIRFPGYSLRRKAGKYAQRDYGGLYLPNRRK